MGETTRGLNDSGRKGKWAKRLRGERESGRNDPDSSDCRFGVSPVNYPDPYPDHVLIMMSNAETKKGELVIIVQVQQNNNQLKLLRYFFTLNSNNNIILNKSMWKMIFITLNFS